MTPMQIELLVGAIGRRRRRETHEQAVLLRMAQVDGRAFARFLRQLDPDHAPGRVRDMTAEQWQAMGVKIRRAPSDD